MKIIYIQSYVIGELWFNMFNVGAVGYLNIYDLVISMELVASPQIITVVEMFNSPFEW